MPMPEGLIPVGNAVGKLKPFMPKAPVPIPASTFLGGSAGASAMAALRNQYDPLPVTDFFDSTEMINNTIPIYIAGTQGHVFVCLHGAGHSAMSFAVAAEKLKFVQFSYLDETQSDLHGFFKKPADKFEEVPDSSQKSKNALVNTQDTETNLILSGDDEPEERKNSIFEAIGNLWSKLTII